MTATFANSAGTVVMDGDGRVAGIMEMVAALAREIDATPVGSLEFHFANAKTTCKLVRSYLIRSENR